MKVLNFGSCNIDYVYSLNHILKLGETQAAEKLEIFPGGKGLNQSIAVAKAGGKIYHACCFGKGGKMLKDELEINGVDVSYTKKVDEQSGHAIIQVSKDGDNSICVYRGSNGMVSREYVDFVLADFAAGDILLLQNEINNIEYIIKKAHEKKMCVILNPSPFTDELKQINFSLLSYIILNEVEASEISGCTEPSGCLIYFKNKYPNLRVVLTLGVRGCFYLDKNYELYQSAFKTETVDATAAGDTFTGYFVAGLLRGDEYSEILKTASAASAIAVSKKGAAPSIPKRSEVIAQLKNMEQRTVGEKSENLLRNQIEKYIENNIKTANIAELSRELGYSTSYISKLITKLTGKTFSENLQHKRCSIAAKKMLNTDLSLSEIINNVGYENESFFRRIFKEQYGKTPLKYRKEGM